MDADTAVARSTGMWSWSYNRANYKFDMGLKWARFTNGRVFASKQVDLYKDDVTDLASLPQQKVLVYAPVMCFTCGYCVTVLVEGRAGLKFPAPPAFIQEMYIQCLAVSLGFMLLGVWLVWHAAFRAQVAAVQLRTRKIRLPVPTQHQLDFNRTIASDFEMTNLYDQFAIPFLMPHLVDSPDVSDDELDAAEPHKQAVRAPGRKGVPRWIHQEFESRQQTPRTAHPIGNKELVEGSPHFEWVRAVQRECWGAEAYCRVCMLFGMMHLIQSYSYWLVIHCVAELGMLWAAAITAVVVNASLWLVWHMDVLAERGGYLPVEACGPIISCVSLAFAYTAAPSTTMVRVANALGIVTVLLQLLWTCRLLVVAAPADTSGSEHPWLPVSFQHVLYLVPPPGKQSERVDDKAWRAVRSMLLACLVLWTIILIGRIVESIMGERMLVSNAGAPPWSRVGAWDGWEFGPTSSKHYMHVSPAQGHFFWREGENNAANKEITPSDLFGFHPEAGDHRRLALRDSLPSLPPVPLAVEWPAHLEPELLACDTARIVVLSVSGLGMLVPVDSGMAGPSVTFSLTHLEGLAPLLTASWLGDELLIVGESGVVGTCSLGGSLSSGSEWWCEVADVPPLFLGPSRKVAVSKSDRWLVATAHEGRVHLYELAQSWQQFREFSLPGEATSLALWRDSLMVGLDDGTVCTWNLQRVELTGLWRVGKGPVRKWRAACFAKDAIVRLAGRWRVASGVSQWRSELLL